jgi:hypothetical protein
MLALRQGLQVLTFYAFAWGLTVLAGRLMLDVTAAALLWGAAGALPAVAVGLWLGWRRRPEAAAVRALLDSRSQAGGLLMAGGEAQLGGWAGRVGAVVRPRIRWQAQQTLGMFALAAVFVGAAFLVPRPEEAFGEPPLQVGPATQRLEEQVEVLEEEEIVTPEEAEAMRKRLERAREEASGNDPVKTWEALDHMARNLKQEARDATEAAAREAEEAAELEMVAKALENAANDLAPEDLARAMKEMRELAQQAAEESRALRRSLRKQGLKTQGSGKWSKEDLQKLGQACQGAAGDLDKMARKLKENGFNDRQIQRLAKRIKKCRNGKSGDEGMKKLSEYLKENQGDMAGCKQKAGRMRPGRGGINRGPGAAPMVFGDPSDPNAGRFKENVLLPTEVADFRDSQLTGLSLGAPETEEVEASTGGALSGTEAGGGSAQTQRILPRHREAVEGYFSRE